MKVRLQEKVVLILAAVLTLMTSVHVLLAGYFVHRQDQAAVYADLGRELAAWRDELHNRTVQVREAAVALGSDAVLLNRLSELMTLQIRIDEESGSDEMAELARTYAYWKTVSLNRLHLVLRTADLSSISVYVDGQPSHQVSRAGAEMMIRRADEQWAWVGAPAEVDGELPLTIWPAWKARPAPAMLPSTASHGPAVSVGFSVDGNAFLDIIVPIRGAIERVVGDDDRRAVTLHVSDLALAGGSAAATPDLQPRPTTTATLVFREVIDSDVLEGVHRQTGKWPMLLSADGRHQQRLAGFDLLSGKLLHDVESVWTDPAQGVQGTMPTPDGLAYAMLLPWRFEGEPRLILGLASPRDSAVQKIRQTVVAMLVTASLILLLTIGIGKVWADRMIDAVDRARGAALMEAERLARLRSEFLAQMSHELRTPLNAILGYAQILRQDPQLDDRQARGLTTIQESGEHLATLIEDILDLSRMAAAKLELYLHEIDLRAFLNGVADIIRVKAEEKSLRFDYQPAPDLPRTVNADDKRLRQVLLNLLGNAVKYTDRGTVTFRVARADVATPPPAGNEAVMPTRLRFEVTDTGIGMGAEQLERIFRPFEQVSDIGHRSGGAGLGLAISRQLVQLMGGEIHVSSQPGRGSAFSFELELPATESQIVAMHREPDVTGYQGPRRKVWIVDDVAQNRAMLMELLAALDFETLDFTNGEEVLDQLALERPDLILMDAMMPVVDGLEATRTIRQRPDLAHLPIIAVSASAAPEDEARSLQAGANAFVSKPIGREKLLKVMGGLLNLEWTRALADVEPQAEIEHLQEEFVVPPPDEMEVLHHLALAGSMRDLRERATYLQQLDPRYARFAQQLERLARHYRSRAILAFVERHRRGS